MSRFCCRTTVAVVLFVGLVLPGTSPAQSLGARIDELLQKRQVDQAFWGIAVYDLEQDSVLFRRNAGHAFLPASNQKLLTTAAALDLLGGTHRYTTSLSFDGTTKDSVMQGDFVLEGSGDPTFGSTALRGGGDPLEGWANRLAQMGVRRIEGRLIANDDALSDQSYPDGWNVNYLTRQKGKQLGVSTGGLSYHDNVVSVTIRATQPGEPPAVQIHPSSVVNLENRAVTSKRWRGSTLLVSRTFSTNEIVLTGSVARSYEGIRNVPVSDPTRLALRAFHQYLQEAGIETRLTIAEEDSLEERPAEEEVLFVDLSPTLSEIVSVVNKRSNNFYAEQLFRTYGWGGTNRGGIRRTEVFLRRAGIETRSLSINDGSGLSRKDLVTPQAVMELLVHMNEHSEREAFTSSLPSGGERNTTLDNRLAQLPVQAKTGSLAFVRALSGYVTQPDGSRVAFALFANNYTGPSYQITHTMDDIVRALARPSTENVTAASP